MQLRQIVGVDGGHPGIQMVASPVHHHLGEGAERIPAWKDAPPEAVIGLAAVWSLFREFVARHGPERIRASRARAAAADRKWLGHQRRHALGR